MTPTERVGVTSTLKVLILRDTRTYKRGDEIDLPEEMAHEAMGQGWAALLLEQPRIKVMVKPRLEAKAIK